MTDIALALKALKENQRQLDMDGCEIGVSRQALDELITAYERKPFPICEYCNGTGDIHSIDGEYKGQCVICKHKQKPDFFAEFIDKVLAQYEKRMRWSGDSTADERMLVYGNLVGFCAFLKKEISCES